MNESSKRGLGLKAKLLLLTLPVVNLALGLIWLVSTRTARDGMLELSGSNLVVAAENLAGALEQALSDARSDARTSSALDLPAQAIETGDNKNMNWYADEMVTTKPKYVAIVVADAAGKIVAANTQRAEVPIEQSLVGASIAGEPWAQAALAATKGQGVAIAASSPDFLRAVLEPTERVVGFSMPVVDILGETVGTLTSFVSVNFIVGKLNGLTRHDGDRLASLAVVIDATGTPVALPRVVAGETEWREAHWAVDGWGSSRHDEWVSPKGVVFYSELQPIGGAARELGWSLIALFTKAGIEAPVKRVGGRLAAVSLAAVAITTFVLVLLAARLVRPIAELTAATQRMKGRAADFAEVEVDARDEVGQLR